MTTDPFALQPLLYPALPAEPGLKPDSPAALGRSLRCAEPYGQYLYLGTSDGKIHCFEQGAHTTARRDDEAPDYAEAQGLVHVSTRVVSSKPIERILVIPAIAVAAVCSEATLTFYALPGFDAIPQQVLPHTKGVAAIALDDAEHGHDAEGLVGLCIIRRKGITLVRVSVDTWRVVKDIPLPSGATAARRFGKWLCISTTSDYSVVDLEQATISSVGLPISQTSEAPSASSRPSIVAIEKAHHPQSCEFLITSHSEDVTLGVFVSQQGEPTSKLVEWPSHPRALALDYPHLHALLRNDTIEVHDVTTLDKTQTVHLPPLLEPRTLSAASSHLELTSPDESLHLAMAQIKIQKGKLVRSLDDAISERAGLQHTSTLRSKILLIGKNAVQCLGSNYTLEAVIKSIRRGSYHGSITLLKQVKQQSARNADILPASHRQYSYIYQTLGMESLRRLRFEDAAHYLQMGAFPLTLLACLTPTLSASLCGDAEFNTGFADVLALMEVLGDLYLYPAANLAMNYSPPLALDDPAVASLCKALQGRVQHFHNTMLSWYREHAMRNEENATRRILDTMLVRALIAQRERDSVSSFLADPSSRCDVALVEKGLASLGCYAALADIARSKGDIEKTLELQSKLLDGTLEDPAFHGGLQDFANILTLCEDAELTHRYGVWLVQRDTAAGIKILTKGKGNVQGTESATFDELAGIDAEAAMAFLEATALGRKQQDPAAHRRVFDRLIQQIKEALSDAKEMQSQQNLAEEYASGSYAESFVAHLSLRSEESPSVVPRLKLMLLLQGSMLLDPAQISLVLADLPVLVYERAIVLGKMGDDEDALRLLAIELRDANSAETYCSQARRPISAVLAQQFVDVPQLKIYVNLVQRTSKRRSPGNARKTITQESDDAGAIDNVTLIKKLLRVYMTREESGSELQIATSHLLNTQAMHMNAIDVLETVPDRWSTKTLETFLSRSLRREMHRSNEGHIQRAMALAQNLEVAQDLWSQRRAMGGVIDEGGADDDRTRPATSDGGEGDRNEVEKIRVSPTHGLSEKVVEIVESR